MRLLSGDLSPLCLTFRHSGNGEMSRVERRIVADGESAGSASARSGKLQWQRHQITNSCRLRSLRLLR